MQKPDVLYSEDQIRARIQAMGADIGEAYADREVVVIGLMKSCLVFMADMIRAIPADLTCHLLRVSASLPEGGTPRTEIVFSTNIPYEGRDILLLDDIVDTGITLNFLLDHIRERKPRSLKVAALIDKPGDRKIEVQVDWAAFTIKESSGDRFVVGYGLDYAERFRGLPYICNIPRPDKPGEARTISIAPGR